MSKSKDSEFETYTIPPNFIEGSTLFGGLFKLRNAIEEMCIRDRYRDRTLAQWCICATVRAALCSAILNLHNAGAYQKQRLDGILENFAAKNISLSYPSLGLMGALFAQTITCPLCLRCRT